MAEAGHDEELIGIDVEPVSRWLVEHVDGATAPFRFQLIAAGGSNLTYRVTDAEGRSWALRRPPVGKLLATAHDMGREWRIISALSPTAVPVPEAVARCDDESITGAGFYVMGFVEGLILRTPESAKGMTVDDCATATDSLVDVQLAFHTLDLDEIGLGDLGKRRDYVQRQLTRWRRQYESAKPREVPLLEELHERLSATIPAEQAVQGLAHGDYRFDNTVLGDDHRIAAVLDWELCTIGDPVADFAWSQLYWADPGDPVCFIQDAPTLHEGFVRRDDVSELYARRSGFDLSDLPWYTVFSLWKQACIVEGVYARRLGGARGGAAVSDVEGIARRSDQLLQWASEAAAGVV
jgi:aminoglycoside phosphotransferase (APT) family kinase protein